MRRVVVIVLIALSADACSSGGHAPAATTIEMSVGATAAQMQAVRSQLSANPDVKSFKLVRNGNRYDFSVQVKKGVDAPTATRRYSAAPGVLTVKVVVPRHT